MGQQHTEWIGVAPFLEEDLAFSSIGQDELGHAATPVRAGARTRRHRDHRRGCGRVGIPPKRRRLPVLPPRGGFSQRLGRSARAALGVRHVRSNALAASGRLVDPSPRCDRPSGPCERRRSTGCTPKLCSTGLPVSEARGRLLVALERVVPWCRACASRRGRGRRHSRGGAGRFYGRLPEPLAGAIAERFRA